MDLAIELVYNGAMIGILYGLFGTGLTLIVGTTGVLHLAHGTTLITSAYLFWWSYRSQGHPLAVALAITCLASIVIGVAFEWLLYRPLRHANASNMVILVASVVVLSGAAGALVLVFGTDVKAIPPVGPLAKSWAVGPVFVTGWHVAVAATTVLVAGSLLLLLKRSQLGILFRAVGDSPERAQSLGYDLDRVHLLAFAVGSLTAAPVAILVALNTPLASTTGFDLLILTFVAVLVGGIGNIRGALVGGIVVGVILGLAAWPFPTHWSEIVLFTLLTVYLIIRPQNMVRAQ